MLPRYHQGVISAGHTEVACPPFFQPACLAEERGLKQSCRVRIIMVDAAKAFERPGANFKKPGDKPASAARRLHPEILDPCNRTGPIDVLVSQIAGIVECIGIVEVARETDLGR